MEKRFKTRQPGFARRPMKSINQQNGSTMGKALPSRPKIDHGLEQAQQDKWFQRDKVTQRDKVIQRDKVTQRDRATQRDKMIGPTPPVETLDRGTLGLPCHRPNHPQRILPGLLWPFRSTNQQTAGPSRQVPGIPPCARYGAICSTNPPMHPCCRLQPSRGTTSGTMMGKDQPLHGSPIHPQTPPRAEQRNPSKTTGPASSQRMVR